MFISRLKDKIAAYDKYKEHRTNGLKALFVLELMILFNLFSSMHNPYFYFFYVPITCLTAETAGTTLKEKYVFLLWTLLGSALSIFLFGVFSVYNVFFIFFVFFYTLALYFIVLHTLKRMLVIVPLMLSLASYSLIYGLDADSNFYIAVNNALQTIAATVVIFAGLSIFPKSYYFEIWFSAFREVITNLETLSGKLCKGEVETIAIFPGIITMERYAKMLPKKIKCFSVLKITLLAFELILTMSYLLSFQKQLRIEYVAVLHTYLARLAEASKNRQPVILTQQELPAFNETHELRLLYQLILSWNYLCADG
ncbi:MULTISPECIES: FUSC family protein [Legionella]|uniref:FUSC family protein n=1 Tax=Legionella TaxID=445 RepID=UPI001E2A8E6D|nr:FUSC family protein [Legionella sp. 31fI33]MCC5015842.1 FUSC family protein [Legionella sp. 31fI33]